MTEETEQFLVSLLVPVVGPAAVPVRQVKADDPLIRPIVLVAAQFHETLIPGGAYPVARINFEITLESQVTETPVETHQALIGAIALGLPAYGQFTGEQTIFDQVFFGPLTGAQDTKNALIRSYTFTGYLVGRLTVPTV
jgi:hypothetical protein